MTTIPGDSGSIIIDSQNHPVGLLASHEAPEVSDLSFMIPIDTVTQFYNTVISELNNQPISDQTAPPSFNADKNIMHFIDLF